MNLYEIAGRAAVDKARAISDAAGRTAATERAYAIALFKAVNRDNATRLHRGIAQDRRARSDDQVKIAYEAAMTGEPVTGLVRAIHVPRKQRGR